MISNQDEQSVSAMKQNGMKLVTAFQIIDEALDYAADQKTLGKEIGDDFREGKMTAPVIFALLNATEEERKFWKRTLGYKKQEKGDFDVAVTYINKHDSLNKSIALARKYAADAKQDLLPLPYNIYKELLSDLTDYTISRSF